METSASSRPAAPAVVAVVVTRNPGPWLDDTVDAIAAQDYPNLAVLFIDAASDTDPTARIARAMPDAYVQRLEANDGYGASANQARGIVDGASFFCFLHDDAAPAPDAIRMMVDEAVRSNAGIVGSKLVQFSDHSRLLQVGESVDKTGERSTQVEPGELDQEQHDAVRDVFVVPSGCMLVRTDLFDAVGGFDEGIDLLNDDLNLCWRAHVAGARVVVAPDAVVGHVEALGDRLPGEQRRNRLVRHRLRTVLCCYSGWHLVRVLPQIAVVTVLEVVYSVLVGRRGQAGDVIGAWRWNWRRRSEIRAWRTKIAEFRGVPDAEIRPLQTRGFARLNAFVRGQSARGGTRSERALRAWRDFLRAVRRGEMRWTLAAWIATAVIVGFGSRHLVFRPIPAVGGFLPFDLGPGELFDRYLSGWRTVGLGSTAPAPTAFGLLAGLGVLFGGAMGTLRRVLLLGSLVAGLVGAHRLVRPAGSPRAQAVALVVYGAIPLAYDAIAGARWGSLTVYGATPWILGRLARASRWAPFDRAAHDAGTAAPASRAVLAETAGLGVLLALVAAVDPAVLPVTVVVAAALALGAVLAGTVPGTLRLLTVAGGGVGVAVALHVPWTLDFLLPGSTWAAVVGRSGAGPAPSLAELFRFDVGPVGGSALAVGLPLAATLPLLIGRGWRFGWAVRAWTVSLTLIGLAWAGGRGWLPLGLPPTETLLAPAAAALAVAAALGVVAFEIDLRAYGFGWRQLAAGAAGLAFLVGAVPTLLDAGNGRWYLPSGGLTTAFSFLDDDDPGYRILWVGDPDVLPVPGQALDVTGADGTVYATTDDGLPTLSDGWPGPVDGPTALIGDALARAVDGETSRLGRLLAPMAVRYVVVPRAAAPRPLGGAQRDAPAALTDALAAQLDLAGVAVNPAYVVYRNEAALPGRAVLAPGAGTGVTSDVTPEDLAGAEPTLTDATGPTTYTGTVAAGSTVLLSAGSSDGWTLEVGGRSAPRVKLFGWAQGFEPATGGDAVLRYDTSPLRYGVLGFQALFWLVAIHFARSARRSTSEPGRGGPVAGAMPGADDGPEVTA